jgi:hypothetical protein
MKGAQMPTTVTISGAQRQAFWEMVTDHLSCAGDLHTLLVSKDFPEAERLGIELAEDLRLMEDLGWDKAFREQGVDLTMPAEDLIEILTRLRSDAEGALRESAEARESREAEETAKRNYQLALDTCDGLLSLLARCEDRQ